MAEQSDQKPLIWIGSTRNDLRTMPKTIQSRFGYALYVAQQGGRHRDAKPLKGFHGAGVIEVVADHRGDTFRCVYTVRLADAVCVLHVFQKKSKSGRATPKHQLELIARRLKEAERFPRAEK